MADSASNGAESPEDAKERYDEAHAALAAAQEAAAEAGAGLAAAKMNNVPDLEVEVVAGNHISHGGKDYYGEGFPFAPDGHEGNDTVVLDGPTALSLMQLGHVTLIGPADEKKGGKRR